MRESRVVAVRNLLAVGVFFLLFSYTCSATNLYVDKMDLSFGGTEPWYVYTGGSSGHIDFEPDNISFGTMYVYDYTGSFGSIFGSLEFLPNLTRDVSSGGRAQGYFEGGATVRVVGGIRRGTTWLYGGIGTSAKPILEATISFLDEDPLNPGQNRWLFQEMIDEEGRFDRTLFLDLVSGSEGLASGITLSTGETLYIVDSKMDLSLKTASAITFVTQDFTHQGFSNIKFTGVPEPASLGLLVVGILMLRKKV